MSSKDYFLRIHKGKKFQSTIGSGWQETDIIANDDNGIRSIEDAVDQLLLPGKIGTSIPTPLARIYLFDTAFRAVCSSSNGKNKVASSYRQLVLDCLDLLQFLFERGNDDKLRLYEIKIDDIKALQESDDKKKKILGDSLAMEMSDKSEFKNSIIVIEYDEIVLGGTSPFTVVYTSPNLRRNVSEKEKKDFSSNSSRPFWKDKSVDLDERDKAFKTYIARFYVTCKNKGVKVTDLPFFQYIFSYKEIEKLIQEEEQKQKQSEEYGNDYPVISDKHDRDKEIKLTVALCGQSIGISYNAMDPVLSGSDFLMKPSKKWCKDNDRPLVLPARGKIAEGSGWIYIDSPYDTNTRIIDDDCVDPINARYLPKNGEDSSNRTSIKYPWLSNSDFFYHDLYDLNYNVNTNKFWRPIYKKDENKAFPFLLPIKDTWFKYFTVDDLDKYLIISNWEDDRVEFELTVPLSSHKDKIVLSREYRKNADDDHPYRWVEMDKPLGLGIFPFYKIKNSPDNPDKKYPFKVTWNEYSVYLFESSGNARSDEETVLRFLNTEGGMEESEKETDAIRVLDTDNKTRTKNDDGRSAIYNIRPNPESNEPRTRFDVIQFDHLKSYNDAYGAIVIPKFDDIEIIEDNGKKAFFAIDFGTSNTHISYWDHDCNKPVPFTIYPEDQQMVLLKNPESVGGVSQYRVPSAFGGKATKMNEFLREFVPQVIGYNTKNTKMSVEYPVRTATLENPKTLTLEDGNGKLFISANIGYDIDNDNVKSDPDFKYSTNLKWALQKTRSQQGGPEFKNAQTRIELYCKQTLWMIKNKIVLKGYSYKDIAIQYFYPESMSVDDRLSFDDAWNKAKDEVFNNCGFICKNIAPEPEAVVPFYSLIMDDPKICIHNLVNVDIGGGTTDIFFFDHGSKQGFEASVRFAADDLWGTAFPNKQSGFVEYIKKLIEGKNYSQETIALYDNFSEKNEASSLASFFFKHSEFEFGSKIQGHKEFRSLLFLHYAAIIWYVRDMFEVIKKKDSSVAFPKVMTFTGKGSDYIKLITSDKDAITGLTLRLLKAFRTEESDLDGFRVELSKHDPKTLTADGGVYKCQDIVKLDYKFVNKDKDTQKSSQKDKYEGMLYYYENITSLMLGYTLEEGEKVMKISDLISNGGGQKEELKKRVREQTFTFLDKVTDQRITSYIDTIGKFEALSSHLEEIKQTVEDSLSIHLDQYINDRKANISAELLDSMFFLCFKNSLIMLSRQFLEEKDNG